MIFSRPKRKSYTRKGIWARAWSFRSLTRPRGLCWNAGWTRRRRKRLSKRDSPNRQRNRNAAPGAIRQISFEGKLPQEFQHKPALSPARGFAALSEGAALEFRDEIVTRTDAECHDSEGGVLARIRDKAGRVHDKEILDVVGLLKRIEHGFLRVRAHAGDPGFVQRPARRGRMRVSANVLCPGSFEHFAGRIAHILDHGALVFAVRHVNFQDRDSVDVFHLRIELDEIFPARQDFAKTRDFDGRARLEHSFLVGLTETRSAQMEAGVRPAFITVTAEKFLVRGSVG